MYTYNQLRGWARTALFNSILLKVVLILTGKLAWVLLGLEEVLASQ